VLDRELEALAGERTFVVATHDPQRVAGMVTTRIALA
jgi:hypothetical protein